MTAVDSKQRRQLIVLAGLGVALTALVVWQFGSSAAGSGVGGQPGAAVARGGNTSRQAAASRARASAAAVDPSALEIRLGQLEAVAPEPAESTRNPFRFRPVVAPPPAAERPGAGGAPVAGPPGVAGPLEPAGPPLPPPPAPIGLKFIGILTETTAGRIAVLSDGKFVYHGREGDIIEGRYRIVKIGEESIQLEYADGRGRQTIRLSGS